MDLALYQIIVILFAIIMIGKGIQSYVSHESGQTFLKLFVRLVVWGGMALLVLFPRISNNLAQILGIEGNINAVILAGFFMVFLLIFKLLSAIEKLEQQITFLTRKEALSESEEAPE